MRVHISLIGGQTMPIYQGIQKANPEMVYLVHSPQTLAKANIIQLECKKLGIKTKKEPIDAVNLDQAKEKAQELLSKDLIKDPNNSITLNITGGPKIWTIAFYETFKDFKNVEIFYTEQGAKTILINTTPENSYLQENIEPLTLDTIFRLNGNPDCKFPKPFVPNKDDLETCNSLLRLYNMDSEQFRKMTNITEIANRMMLKGTNEAKERTVYQAVKQLGDAFGKCKVSYQASPEQLNVTFGKSKTILRSPECFNLFFNFRWFEYFVAAAIAKWSKCQNLYRNISYGKEKEFDIIAHIQSPTATKALFVECKTSLDKPTKIREFAQAVRNYGGSGSIALFISYWAIPADVMMTCLKSNVIPFSIANDVGKNIEIISDPQGPLYKLLDESIGVNRA